MTNTIEEFKNLYVKKMNQDVLSKSEVLRYLNSNIEYLKNGWDSIIEHNGNHVFYDYERSHRSKEEYGKVLTLEEVNKFKALKELKNDIEEGKLTTVNPVWSY
jgi:hypothetical protein